MRILLTVGLIKKISLYRMSHFLEPYTCSKIKIKIELDLSNYGTNSDLKQANGVDTSKFAKKVYLASLKSYLDELGIGKLKTIAFDLSKLSNVVDNVVKQV